MAAPRVSICLPTFNGARWIGEAIESALAQTMRDFELVVVDNASADETVEIVEGYADERIRLVVNDRNIGAPRNHNLAVQASRAPLVKFLHHDDLLAPRCLERMVPLFDDPRVGLVFSRREVILADADDPAARVWKERFATLHDRFGPLERTNDGRRLLAAYLPALAGPFLENWVGEPSAVMARRAALDRAGLFDPRMRQSWDVDLWLRLMAVSDVGFVDEALASFRLHAGSLTEANAQGNEEWLDLVWLYEGLLAAPGTEAHRRQLRGFRRRESARVGRRALARLARRDGGLRPLAGYVAHRARRRGAAPL